MALNFTKSYRQLPILTKVSILILLFFAIVGLFFFMVFIAMQFNIFKVRGAVSSRNLDLSIQNSVPSKKTYSELLCKISKLNSVAPDTARKISSSINNSDEQAASWIMLERALRQFPDNKDLANSIIACSKNPTKSSTIHTPQTAYSWANSAEWRTLTVALTRDSAVINQAARDAGISPRLIIAGVIGEQFRFFSGFRTAFKNYFEPLKIFGRLSKFSYGIAGLKPDTVRIIEDNLTNADSIFYLGKRYERFAFYPQEELSRSDDPQLYRITDPDNNYYSYLYVGLYMRQVTQQWSQSGYDISNNAGVLATLYNLGFNRSIPKANPLPGGAIITINNKKYTFGELGEEFYWSGELLDIFPIEQSGQQTTSRPINIFSYPPITTSLNHDCILPPYSTALL